MRHRILFVCLGNICRSPTAEGAFMHAVQRRRLDDCFDVDSAGTGDWHIGKPPDERAQRAAQRRGIDISALRARQIRADDFRAFDCIVAMDNNNYADLQTLADEYRSEHRDERRDEQCRNKVRLLTNDEIPDPYYGDENGFDRVFDLITRAVDELIDELLDELVDASHDKLDAKPSPRTTK